MSERERWIVYPLLFLALGASLRDKIIKTTESQRIKCQGLWVSDSNDNPLLVLGPEQFPELAGRTSNLLQIDGVLIANGSVTSQSVSASSVSAKTITGKRVMGESVVGNKLMSPQNHVGLLEVDAVVAKNYVLTDGKNQIRLDGRYTVPLFNLLQGLQNRGPQKKSAGATERVPPKAESAEKSEEKTIEPSKVDDSAAAEENPEKKPETTGEPALEAPKAKTAEPESPAGE